MSLKKYEAFVRTVELGSLTKAAEAMGSTQSRIRHPQRRRRNRPAGGVYQRGCPLAARDDPDVPERPPQG